MPLHTIRRRQFLKNTALLGAGLTIPARSHAVTPARKDHTLNVSIFSKHLQFLGLADMAQAAADMGFDGVDLSVRPNGHVEPDRVGDQLPEAVEAFRKAGFPPSMMTCSVLDADNPTDRSVLETAAKSGFRFYRMNYFHYLKDKTMPESVDYYRQRVGQLAAFNRKLGITGCYQNHAGNYIGASVWELFQLVKDVEKQDFGLQYDIRHAVVEGGLSWTNGLKLVRDRISTLALKDFRWEKTDGKWKVTDCPVGEGMVDFLSFFRLIKDYNLQVPVSLHYEYPLGGAERGNKNITLDRKIVFESMRRDLDKVRELWQKA